MKTLLIIASLLLISPPLVMAFWDAGDFQVTSPAFGNNEVIPKDYTCNGGDVNPPLIFKNVPPKTKSFAITVSDPDAPEGVWSHWVVYNISPATRQIKENSNPGTEGLSDFGKYVYGGPCPQDEKVHHYIFRVFALNDLLYINEGPSFAEVEKAVRFHTIAKSELTGTYQKLPF